MENSSRTKNAVRNMAFGFLNKILNLLFAFISRTAFIYILGSTYLGVNGLYSEILNLLSITELGFGSAMVFSMYKPVAENDEVKIIQLLDFNKKIFRLIGCLIALIGISITPFLDKIVRGADWLTLKELKIYFLIFLFNTVISYFVTYKYTYLNALQKNYIQTNIDAIVITVSSIIQIFVIILTKSFLLYLIANSVVLLISRVAIIYYLNKKYPILVQKPGVPLSKTDKKGIFHEVKGLAIHQLSGAAVHSTDNLLISMITEQGVNSVGLISNYNMLINSVLGFVSIIFNSVISGFGNLAAASTTENFKKVFKEINFVNFWIYGFCCIAFWILIPPFITLWIGNDKLIDSMAFNLIILNCYLQGQSTIYNNARISKGNFNKDKTWAIVQALVNLVVSVVCAKHLGLVGIYVGTIVSRLVYVIFRPYSTYRFLFGESSLNYYKTLVIYLCDFLIAAFITKCISYMIVSEVTIITFIINMIIVLLTPNVVFLILNFRRKEFSLWISRLKGVISR